jgi:hypothetical protein
VECGRDFWVEDSLTDAGHVRGDAVDAMGVDAAEVGEDKGFGYDESIGGRNAVTFEDGLDEVLSGGRGDVEFRG